MNPANGFSLDIAHAIQLALAPVFLFSGIAALLGVMASRLGRIIDRGRRIIENPPSGRGDTVLSSEKIALELRTLERRRRLASKAITATTLAELLVCLVIATLFLEVLMDLPLKWLVGLLFTGSTVVLVVGLTLFLREVHLGNQTVRIELER